jgi:hypothetical protein
MLTTAGLVTDLSMGQVLDYVSPNQYGGIAYLWTFGTPAWLASSVQPFSTTMNMFDAMTGKYVLSIVNGTAPYGLGSSGLTVDAGGNLIAYYTNTTAGTQTIYGTPQPGNGPTPYQVTTSPGQELLEVWNSTQCILAASGWLGVGRGGAAWSWRPPQSVAIPFSYGIQSAWLLNGTFSGTGATLPQALSIKGVNSGVVILQAISAQGLGSYFQTGFGIFEGVSTTQINSTKGNILFTQNITFTPYTAVDLDNYGNVGNGVFLTVIKETGQVTAFSVQTGIKVWQTTLTGANGGPINPYDNLGGIKGNIYGNSFLIFGFGGDIWSLDMGTGKVNWYTNTTVICGEAGANTPYGIWPIWVQTGIGGGGGVAWFEVGHEYSPPLFLGAQLIALNTTTGEPVWTIHSFAVDANPALAYGIMTTLDAYDNQIYAYGKGPSKVTVTAPNPVTSEGAPIVIRGTVTDISAGSQQEAVAANFPNGLPCVSDASMSHFMEAVYMQQPMPTNTTGVEVTLDAIDPNNNFVHLGTATSDASGNFGFAWTPPDVPGKYTIIATFAGSESYYASYAETYAVVSEAPPVTPPPQYPVPIDPTWTIVGIGIAIIIAVVLVGVWIKKK